MKKVSGFGFLIYFFVSCSTLWSQSRGDSATVLHTARADIEVLCSDSLAGRGYQRAGHYKAATYVANRFAEIGLKPVAGLSLAGNPYFQGFGFKLNRIDSVYFKAGRHIFKPGIDYIPAPETQAANKKYAVVDLGYGLYADFQKKDVAGKLVVIKTGLPPNYPLPDSLKKRFKNDAAKLQLAQVGHAAGVILLEPKLTASFAEQALPIIVLELKAKRWHYGPEAEVLISARQQTIASQNVVGYLPADIDTDSSIVLCAHYDHLGRIAGEPHAALFRGASDNASGVAFLLGLAKKLTKLPRPRYNLVFVAFGGEEPGLKGSLGYVTQHVAGPLLYTRAAINFDLLGNGQKGVVAEGSTTYPELYGPLAKLNDSLKLINPLVQRANAPNSDHYPFTLRGVPALFFYTLGGAPNYHDVYDVPQAIKLPVFYRLHRLIIAYISKLEQASH